MIINNSFYDGVDADFSNLNFKNFTVVKSGNDCLDFSWGNYIVENSLIKECNDKAISVGEFSNLIIKDSVILKSNIGIASKDYSKTTSINNEIKNTKYCYQAYNKKQEFSGGKIVSKNTKCKHSDKIFYKDNYSSIKIDSNFRTEEKILLGVSDYLKIINIIKDLGGKKFFQKEK